MLINVIWLIIFVWGVIMNRKYLGLESVWNWCWQLMKSVWNGFWQLMKSVWNRFWQLMKFVWNGCWQLMKFVWNRGNFLWTRIKKNNVSLLLVIAWAAIGFSIWRFSPDLYKLYKELAGQILEGEKTDDEYRGIAIRYFGIIAGAGTIIGYIIATARNIISDKQNKAADEQNRISERGQITENTVQAITQISTFNNNKPNIDARLGGLYSLQRIMKDNPKDELTIAKIFYAYVRENAKRSRRGQPKQKRTNGKEVYQIPEDIQAVLNIIQQFSEEWRKHKKKLLTDSQLNFSYSNFKKYHFKGIDFSNAILKYANFTDADLAGVDLTDADLSGADLSGANLVDVNFKNTILNNVVLRKVDLTGAVLFNKDLSGLDLSGAILSVADLSEADLSEVKLSNANLSGANLSIVKLRGANLSDADLRGANLSDADLRDANLSGADLEDANLAGADLRGANLSGADLFDAELRGAIVDKDEEEYI